MKVTFSLRDCWFAATIFALAVAVCTLATTVSSQSERIAGLESAAIWAEQYRDECEELAPIAQAAYIVDFAERNGDARLKVQGMRQLRRALERHW